MTLKTVQSGVLSNDLKKQTNKNILFYPKNSTVLLQFTQNWHYFTLRLPSQLYTIRRCKAGLSGLQFRMIFMWQFWVFSHMVLVERTDLSPLQMEQKVDQQNIYMCTYIYLHSHCQLLKVDSLFFWVHLRSDGASLLSLFSLEYRCTSDI